MDNKRSFTIDHAEVSVKNGGRFISSGPWNAAKKAIKQIYQEGAKKKEIRFTLRETTQGSEGKEYAYIGARFKLDKPKVIKFGNTEVKYVYDYEVRRCGPYKKK
jgi:hypothetical protein